MEPGRASRGPLALAHVAHVCAVWRLFSPLGKLRHGCPRPNTCQRGAHAGQEFEPGGITADDLPAKSVQEDDEKVIDDFREMVLKRLEGLGLAVLDARLDGEETKSRVGYPSLGSPGKWVVKKIVQQVKQLAREYAASLGDPELLRRIERATEAEQETIGRRRAAMAARCLS